MTALIATIWTAAGIIIIIGFLLTRKGADRPEPDYIIPAQVRDLDVIDPLPRGSKIMNYQRIMKENEIMDYKSVLEEQIRELQKLQDSARDIGNKVQIAEQIRQIVSDLQRYGRYQRTITAVDVMQGGTHGQGKS